VLLAAVCKSPGHAWNDANITVLLTFSHKSLLAEDLNAKHPFWNSIVSEPTGAKLLNLLSEILSFRTLSIVLVLKNKLRKHEVSETGSVSVLRCGKKPILLGPLERASPNHNPKRRVSLSLFLNTRTMDRVRKLNISESYTPSSESYSNY
jgi:hypothetical protein